ncbi:F-box/kelch-repeat protein At3g23880-like [Chenopodium quinoa]|uniref:F-box domain-containing protein n=1 Tax=Chenopodium quinoa TaxID=63459 RepID=A0A803MXI8_CHEQI|nr:F-box/kelch-repeat protein At3g23880-like [Chenopodium quinoa]
MADLPTDSWTEILARLPAKSLMRLRCVCKSWCSLIDSSDFIVTHLHIYNKKRKYLIEVERYKSNIRSIDTFTKIDVLFEALGEHAILGSSYGLYLLKNVFHDIFVSLYNPCIRKSFVIPPSPFSHEQTILYRLGFAPSSNDYKLLTIGCFKFPEFSIAVYSLNDNLWRIKGRFHDHIRGLLLYKDEGEIYFKGAMYWLGFDQGSATHLIWFDFDSEEFNLVDLPDALKQTCLTKMCFVLGESIAVFGMSSDRTCIWVLVEDGGDKSWRLWYTGDVNLEALQFLTGSNYSIGLTGIVNEEKNTLLVQHSVNDYFYGMCSYNFKSHQIQHLDFYNCRPKSIDTYVETLVLHKQHQRGRFDN